MPQNPIPVQISVVIPTCDRKAALLSLLDDLDKSDLPLLEVIIVDSGNDRLVPADYAALSTLDILYMGSERSVCIQRNAGIAKARAPWIFLCDDDVEMPPDYLRKLSVHIHAHPEAGAVCGLFLQQENNEWKGSYPVDSAGLLLWKYLFSLGFWGEIRCGDGRITRRIRKYYLDKGNHISRSGWPVLVDFSGPFFITPVYTLGAALVKKDWLLQAPFDELLDRHGIGDNYGVCVSFPEKGVHVLTDAFVHHHKTPVNRLQRPLQYFRRVLAIDYFRRTKAALGKVSISWLLWSLTGNLLAFLRAGDLIMIRPALRSILLIASGRNPYYKALKNKRSL